MKRFSMLPLLLAAMVDTTSAATLTGTVTDIGGYGLAGVDVALALSGTKTTSDELGGWSLEWPTTSIHGRTSREPGSRWTGEAVEVALSDAAEVSIEVFSAQGGSLGRIALGRVEAGLHRVPLPRLPGGPAWVRVVAEGRSEVLQVGAVGAIKGLAGAGVRPNAARAMVVPDTLLFSWRSSVRARQLLKAMPTSGILVQIDTSSAWIEPVPGTMTDARDGHVYRTVSIGAQTWMAENLDWSGSGLCRGEGGSATAGSSDSCAKYGRLYRWSEAMEISGTFDASSWTGSDAKVRGVCPTGWHIPSDSEWTRLTALVEKDPRVGASKAGRALKSVAGWHAESDTAAGFDAFGFDVRPVGFQGTDLVFRGLGTDAYFWSASQAGESRTWLRAFYFAYAYATRNPYDKAYRFSVRCLQD